MHVTRDFEYAEEQILEFMSLFVFGFLCLKIISKVSFKNRIELAAFFALNFVLFSISFVTVSGDKFIDGIQWDQTVFYLESFSN